LSRRRLRPAGLSLATGANALLGVALLLAYAALRLDINVAPRLRLGHGPLATGANALLGVALLLAYAALRQGALSETSWPGLARPSTTSGLLRSRGYPPQGRA